MVKIIEREEPSILTPRDIYDYLSQYVIGQERAKRVVAIAAYNHFKRLRFRESLAGETSQPDRPLLKKSNILMIGPTGCGKTHIARNLAQVLDVPFAVVDATEYTEAGYYGKDVEVIIGELLHAADMDVDRAQKGIVFIDEIDKIGRRSSGARTGAGGRDIGGEGVQQGMLKLLEGSQVFVPYNITQHWNKHDFVQMDTTDILFICAGTFSDIQRGSADRPLGFGTLTEDGQAASRRKATIKDLMDYGLLAEFLGRVPVLVELEELTDEQMMTILTDPPDSTLKEFRQLFAMDRIDLQLTPGALKELVAYSRRRKLGARGLRSAFEELMHDYMFEAPELSGQSIVIDEQQAKQKLS